jgi:hypothetical protein
MSFTEDIAQNGSAIATEVAAGSLSTSAIQNQLMSEVGIFPSSLVVDLLLVTLPDTSPG